MRNILKDQNSSFLDDVGPKLNKMGLIVDLRGGCFVYTQAFNVKQGYKRLTPETILTYQLSGRSLIECEHGKFILAEGQLFLLRRNQVANTSAIPLDDKKCERTTVILSVERLQKFAMENGVDCEARYTGEQMILMEPNDFLKNFYTSINSYSDLWDDDSGKLATIKINEAIELLLMMRPDLKSFLFDFADPHKQDLTTFMLRNYRYNVSIEQFAKLSGRSLTGFKRDFAAAFNTPPAQWLKNKRLEEAYRLIQKKKLKADDIYNDLGFENLSHFYTAFKQRYGITPAQVNLKKANAEPGFVNF
jgi:AraC-like DNA-binding protein